MEKAELLKFWIAREGFSRKEFAEKMEMSVTTVNGWCSNKNIPDKKWEFIKCFFEEMESKRTQIKIWLKQHNTTAKQLSATLGVSESAIYGWCSKRAIPQKRWEQMQEIFCQDSEKPEPGCIAVQIEFSDEEWEKISSTIPDGMDKVEFVKQTMLRLIKAARLPSDQ